jgi:TolB-like protein/Tfp pilus assembly protein PilF
MSHLKRLIHEIHRRSLWQVLLIYCGAALVAYQAVQALTEGLGLPQWFPAFAIVLFIVGLPIVLATAFLGEVAPPTVKPAEPTHLTEAGEAQADAVHLETRRRQRFLTWRNAAATFVVVLAAWGIVAAGWMLFGRGDDEGATATDRPSVAVLPLANRSGLEEDQYFTDGFHDEILTQLSKIGGLSVRGRTSVLEYRDRPKNIRQIGEELNARYVMEGGVLRAGGTVRITVQLMDAETDEHVFAETYDRELSVENLLAVQREVALSIADSLEATLTMREREQIERVPTENLEAYDYYLRGLEYSRRSLTEADERITVEMFERATRLDPDFALAFARLSQAHTGIYWWRYDRSQERLEQAKRAADRALELEPDLPEAHLALGYYYYHGHLDYERAMQEFETALSQQPNNADLLEGMGYVERRRGDFQTALSYLQRAVELDPRDASKLYNLAETQGLLGHYAEADSLYERALTLAPDMMIAYALRALNYFLWQGNTSKARAVLEEAVDRGLDAVDDPWVGYGLVLSDIGDGHYEAALERLFSGSSAAFSTQGYYVPKAMMAADVYALMNEPGLARQHLDSAVALLEAEIERAPEDSRLYGVLGLAYARQGRVDEAIRAGERGVELLPDSLDAMNGRSRIEELARILTIAGRHDEAIDRLEYLLSVPGFMSAAVLRSDPQWDPLRDHPRFQALLEKYEQQ